MGVMDTINSFLGGSEEETQTTTVNPYHMEGKDKEIYKAFQNQFRKLFSNLQGLQSTKEGAYGDLQTALKDYGGGYQSTIESLIDSITSGNNDLSFSLGGGNSAAFTPSSVRSNASTVSDLAGGLYKNQIAEPLSTFNFLSENNDYATNLSYYNILSALQDAIQDRRYGLVNTTTTAADTGSAGLNDVLSGLQDTAGGIGSLAALFL